MPTTRPAIDRFREKVRVMPSGCHEWTGCITEKGYGKFRVGSATDGTRRTVQAHRWNYERVHGPIPEGLEPDHLCRNRRCVRLDHLEPVTKAVNTKRGLAGELLEVCRSGRHKMNDQNTYVKPDGKRVCRPCKNERTNAWKRNKRKSAAAGN